MINTFVTLYQNENENQTNNYITISIKPEYTIKSGAIDLELLYDNEDFSFDLIDISQPYEINGEPAEVYNNGLIFCEYIYPSENEVVSFINVDIINKEDNTLIKECDYTLELYQLNEEPNDNMEINPIHFSYSNVGTLLKSNIFYNSITLSNVVFYSRKPKDDNKNEKNAKNKDTFILPYLLICYVNDRINNNFSIDKIKWNIRIFSDNMLSFVKDTSKIQHENKIKEAWETAQVGRKSLANESRQKFIVLTKKMKGIKLTEEEFNLLLKERTRNALSEGEKEKEKDNTKISKQVINKNSNQKSIAEKNNDLSKKDDVQSEILLPIIEFRKIINASHFEMCKIINSDRKIKKSNSTFVKKYNNCFNRNRTIRHEGGKQNSVLSDTKYRLKNEKINEDYEKSEKMIKKSDYFAKSRENYKSDADQMKFKRFVNKFEKTRFKASNSMIDLMKKRQLLNQSLTERIKFEKKIKDILSGVINLEIDEMSSISYRAKEIMPKNHKVLDELDLMIKRKQNEEETSLNKNIKKK